MSERINLTLNNQIKISLPYSESLPSQEIKFDRDITRIDLLVSDFPKFRAISLAPLIVDISCNTKIRSEVQMLVSTLDPDLILDIDTKTLGELDIAEDTIYYSTN